MNVWDERYRHEGFAYGTEPNDFLKEVRDRLPSTGRALCLAEGEGRNAVYLAQQGFEVTAMDGSKVGLEKAKGLASQRGVSIHTVVADLNDFEIEPAAFDAVVLIWCHLAQPLRSRIHRAAVAGLRPGGAFVLESYTPKQLEYKTGGPPTVELLQRLDDLRPDVSPLRLDMAREIEREVHEGRLHRGHSAVVQVFGVAS
jgi:SAM-dependent methyltransferase